MFSIRSFKDEKMAKSISTENGTIMKMVSEMQMENSGWVNMIQPTVKLASENSVCFLLVEVNLNEEARHSIGAWDPGPQCGAASRHF